jgi:hypothetical protein
VLRLGVLVVDFELKTISFGFGFGGTLDEIVNDLAHKISMYRDVIVQQIILKQKQNFNF